jgi:putative peptide zinc metalloprotease protein
VLPALREELELHAAPAAADGSPTWSLHDPVRNLYFRIDWLTFEILSRWHLRDPQQILKQVVEATTIELEPEDMDETIKFLSENELIQRHDRQGCDWYCEQLAKRRSSPWSWVLHRYLFFRVPLWRPDGFLNATHRLTSPLYTRSFFWLTLVVLVVGLVEASRQWQSFVATLVDIFSLKGLLAFLVTLVFVKFFHELGHAYTAKRYGCRIPTMGIAFLVLFPMAYTDVNDGWKLRDRKQRLRVGAAGVSTELIIAVWALLAWAMLPDGYLRTGAFLLATTTWISTVLINATPFLRFDGYFLLMDWLDMPNLHQRAFAMGRWRLRQILFGLNEAPPEYLSAKRHRGLIIFAWLTWLYRLIVFVGIAVLVYWLFPKPVGPFLAVVELYWFIGRPIWSEVKEWQTRMQAIFGSRRTGITLFLLGLLILFVSVPWDSRIGSQGVLRPVEHFTLFSPGPARVMELVAQDAQPVTKGSVIMQLDGSDLVFERKVVATQLETLRWQEEVAGVDAALRARRSVLVAARRKTEAELASLDAELARYTLRAPFDGYYFATQVDMRVGSWVAENERLGTILDPTRWQVVTYLSEAELNRISVGNRARFYSEAHGSHVLSLQVERIDKDATRVLNEGILASTRGGSILVRDASQGQLVPERAIYRVTLSVMDESAYQEFAIQRGRVVIMGTPGNYIGEFMRSAAAVFVREAGL